MLSSGRILLPLYSDTYSFSLMAVSDDDGKTWYASEPLIGFGNIQPAVLERKDGSLVAYMRENGITDKIRVAESTDGGKTWGPVGELDMPNPGSGLDAVRLANGHWVLIYNDTGQGPQPPGRLALRRRRQNLGATPPPGEARPRARITIRRSSRATTARSTPSTATSSKTARA